MFTRSFYIFIIQCLQSQLQPTGDNIPNANPSFYVPQQFLKKYIPLKKMIR